MAVGPIFAPQQIPMMSSFFASAEAQLDQCEKSQEQAQQQVQGHEMGSGDTLEIMVFYREIIPRWPNYSGEWNMIIYPDTCDVSLN